jgi:hypothetical protein
MTTSPVGLRQAMEEYNESINYVEYISDHVACMTNPNASLEDRLNAYDAFSEISLLFSSLLVDCPGAIDYANGLSEATAYLKSQSVTVPNPNKDPGQPAQLPVLIDGRPATLYDMMLHRDMGDSTQDFSVAFQEKIGENNNWNDGNIHVEAYLVPFSGSMSYECTASAATWAKYSSCQTTDGGVALQNLLKYTNV